MQRLVKDEEFSTFNPAYNFMEYAKAEYKLHLTRSNCQTYTPRLFVYNQP
jgi:hypothetical protein